MQVTYVPRDQVGYDSSLPRLGTPVPEHARTEIVVHHTAASDDDPGDNTPNIWDSYTDARLEAVRMQTVRPDLGKDVPYSFTVAITNTPAGQYLVIFEGRGLFRQGAHTSGHNRSALGIAFLGNFEKTVEGVDMADVMASLGGFIHDNWLPMFPNLLTSKPGGIREVWGHKDFKNTACPGKWVWKNLNSLQIANPTPGVTMKPPLSLEAHQGLVNAGVIEPNKPGTAQYWFDLPPGNEDWVNWWAAMNAKLPHLPSGHPGGCSFEAMAEIEGETNRIGRAVARIRDAAGLTE